MWMLVRVGARRPQLLILWRLACAKIKPLYVAISSTLADAAARRGCNHGSDVGLQTASPHSIAAARSSKCSPLSLNAANTRRGDGVTVAVFDDATRQLAYGDARFGGVVVDVYSGDVVVRALASEAVWRRIAVRRSICSADCVAGCSPCKLVVVVQ